MKAFENNYKQKFYIIILRNIYLYKKKIFEIHASNIETPYYGHLGL